MNHSFDLGFAHARNLWCAGLTLELISNRPEYDASYYGNGMRACVRTLEGWIDEARLIARHNGADISQIDDLAKRGAK